MLARIRVFLPFEIYLPANGIANPPIERVCGERRALLYPPFKSALTWSDVAPNSDSPMLEVGQRLEPSPSPPPLSIIKIDGQATIPVDTLSIDVFGTTFDRASSTYDPTLPDVFVLVNSFLSSLRDATNATWIREVDPADTFTRYIYLNDDLSELEHAPPLVRQRFVFRARLRYLVLSEPVWEFIRARPAGWEPKRWRTLLLDASNALPEIGPAIVLANTALEIQIATALDLLAAASPCPPELWRWINDRKDYRKEPSVGEQFDALLRAVSGKSLKDDSILWEGFQHLRDARNSFVHGGQCVFGRRDEVVTAQKAHELVSLAHRIAGWVDSLLPEPERWTPLRLQSTIEAKLLVRVPDESSEAGGKSG